MASEFRFGLQAMDRSNRDVVVAAAQEAENLGYDEYWSSDHLGISDPFIPLMSAAEATSTLRVGPLVLNNEFHHPALLARTAATVDRFTGGRLTLGLGTGYMESEHDAIGQPIRPPGPRVTRFEESVAALRSLLDAGEVHQSGDHHQLDIDDLGVRPIQDRVPILIGGHGRRVVSIAARHADIFQFTGLTRGEGGAPEPGGFAISEIEIRNGWFEEAAGDRLDQIERSSLVQLTHVGDDAESVIAEKAAEFGLDEWTMEETPFVLVGSVDQIVDKIHRLRERVGISHYVIRDAAGFAPVLDALG